MLAKTWSYFFPSQTLICKRAFTAIRTVDTAKIAFRHKIKARTIDLDRRKRKWKRENSVGVGTVTDTCSQPGGVTT